MAVVMRLGFCLGRVAAGFLVFQGCGGGSPAAPDGGAGTGGAAAAGGSHGGGGAGTNVGGAAGSGAGGQAGASAGGNAGANTGGNAGANTGGNAGASAGGVGGAAGTSAGGASGVTGTAGAPAPTCGGAFGWGASAFAVLSPDTTLVALFSPPSHLEVRTWPDDTLVAAISNGIYGVTSLAFSGDGTQVVGATADGVKIWKVSDGSLVTTISGLANATMLATSANGGVVAAGFSFGTIYGWQSSDPTTIATVLATSTALHGVAVSPDGSAIAATYTISQGLSQDTRATAWPPLGGTAIWDHDYAAGGANRLAFSADGTLVAIGEVNGTISLYDNAPSGTLVRTVAGFDPWQFSPDGTALVGTANNAGAMVPAIFHVGDGTLARAYPTPSMGTLLAIGAGPNFAVRSVDLTASGFGFAESGVRVGSQNGTFTPSAQYVAVSPDGHTVASVAENGNQVSVWNADTLAQTLTHPGGGPIAFGPDGTLFQANGTHLVHYPNGQAPVDVDTKVTIDALAVAPSGLTVALGNADNTATLRDATTGVMVSTLWDFNDGHTAPVTAIAFSHDGATVATGSADKTIKLWTAATAAFVRTVSGAQGTIDSLAFTSDGARLLSADGNGDLRLWKVADGTSASKLHLTTPNIQTALSPDDATVYVASLTLSQYHLADWSALPDLPGHTSGIDAVALSADGKRLVSGSGMRNGGVAANDGTARLDCLP